MRSALASLAITVLSSNLMAQDGAIPRTEWGVPGFSGLLAQ